MAFTGTVSILLRFVFVLFDKTVLPKRADQCCAGFYGLGCGSLGYEETDQKQGVYYRAVIGQEKENSQSCDDKDNMDEKTLVDEKRLIKGRFREEV